MKIQELAIIFVIIILPISLLLSEYTQFQIQTINMQTTYDTKLTTATYDAIKAYQLNSINESYSDLANSNIRGLEASVATFRNSIMTAFELNGYTQDELDNYIPALVYTLYDGLYIYSPYHNVNYQYATILDNEGNVIGYNQEKPIQENGKDIYGLKPYIKYSCRYLRGTTDVVITYALDNYVTVQGKIGDEYINKSGYLIDGITVLGDTVKYNGIEIKAEHLKEYILLGEEGRECSYVKINGVKYYLIENYDDGETIKDVIAYIANGILLIDTQKTKNISTYKSLMQYNDSAIQYYKKAHEFTEWFKNTELVNLTYANAVDEVTINDDGTTQITNIWSGDARNIFNFNSGTNPMDNIENETSEFNQHRLAIIRHIIEKNLAIAVSNYNSYSGAAISNVFQMPELKEDEWEHITHNICMISFLQGLHIGGKIYNGYSLVTNSESKEVVLEEHIYILGQNVDNGTYAYHKINDKGFTDGSIVVNSEDYANDYTGAGRLNLDFKRHTLTIENEGTYYYYPLKEYNASYDSIVMQNNVTTYDDIYEYVNNCGNNMLQEAFYTAIARERYSQYNSNNENNDSIKAPYIPAGFVVVENTYRDKGLVVQDSSGNQFVWVEVPRTGEVYKTAGLSITDFTGEELKAIERDLKKYTSEYSRAENSDEGSLAGELGITEAEYNEQKKKMLKSVYKNGGFYIGRYETGITTARTSASDALGTAVIKQNVYPYNYVTMKQARELSESFETTGYETSLMFGVQWDLVLKYLEVSGAATQEQLSTNSTSWGNQKDSAFNITNTDAKYWENITNGWQSGAYGNKAAGTKTLLSTGASDKFALQNIYDLSGNVWESTLENSGIRRGASHENTFAVEYRQGLPSGYTAIDVGFRVCLYRSE